MGKYVYMQVLNKLIRRYKYLEKAFEEEIKKVLRAHHVLATNPITSVGDDACQRGGCSLTHV